MFVEGINRNVCFILHKSHCCCKSLVWNDFNLKKPLKALTFAPANETVNMKKYLLLLIPILFSIALQGNVTEIIRPEVPVSKTIRFSIFAAIDYTAPSYKHSKAQVLLSIWKYKGGEPELVWSQVIDQGQLRNYPNEESALFREVHINNVREKSEELVAGYKIIYNSKGSELSYDKGYLIPAGNKAKELTVAL